MIKEIEGVIQSKLTKHKVNKRLFEHFSKKLTPLTIAGEKNYNIEQRTLKSILKKEDIEGAKKYISQQSKKLQEQKIKTLKEKGEW